MPDYAWSPANLEATIEVARELAALLPSRGVVQLTGNLGAGKTTLVAALVEALGVAPSAEVSSPTFTLDEPRQFYTLGLEDIFDANALVLIEWGEKFARFLPPDRSIITIAHGEGDHREITATGDRLLSRTE